MAGDVDFDEDEDEAPAPPDRRRRRRRQSRFSQLIVTGLALAAGVGGALAGAHPTGTAGIDPLYAGAFAVLVTLACSIATRSTWLWLTAIAVAMSRTWLLIPAATSLGVAFGSVFRKRRDRRLGALVGALASQVVLRWPHVGFQGLTALVALVAIVPCLLSAHRKLGRRARRRIGLAGGLGVLAVVVLAVPVVIGGLLARSPASAGVSETRAALRSASGGNAAKGTAQLRQATSAFNTAMSRTGSWWTMGGRLIPIVSQQSRALDRGTHSARDLTAAAEGEEATVDLKGLGYHDGQIDLARIRTLAAPLARLNAQLASTQAQLDSIRSSWLIEPVQSRLRSIDTEVAKAHHTTNLASQAVRLAPAILGGDGVRHYFVAFETPAESRGLGGLIGAYGELTVDQGRISLTRSGDASVDLNAGIPDGQRHINGPPGYLARYGAFEPQNYFEDLTYSPDLPAVTQVIAQMYPQSGGDPIDGVLAIDPEGLASLLRFTGPVNVPGLTTSLNSSNAANILLKTQYLTLTGTTEANLGRRDLLQVALAQAFGKLVHGSLPSPRTLSADLDPAVRQGHLLFWSTHPAEQPLLRETALAGAFPQAGKGDLLALTTQNADNNKIDAYLYRTIDDDVTYNSASGAVRSTVTITLHNTAPASGLPAYVIGGYPGSTLPLGTNLTWMSLYSPLGLAGATINGAPLSVGSGNELGVHAYSAYVKIPPEGTVTIVAHLEGAIAPSPTYRLSLRQQPMVNPDHDTVEVRSNSVLTATAPTRWVPNSDLVQSHMFRLPEGN